VLDTVRADRLEPFGCVEPTSPFLAQIARKSAVLERAFSTSSWTPPAVASLFTGLYPTRHGVVNGFHAGWEDDFRIKHRDRSIVRMNRIPPQVATLPELLRGAGWRTFGVAANINIGEEIGFSRGFERFRSHRRGTCLDLEATIASWRSEITATDRSFLYIHMNDAHEPYEARSPWCEPGSTAAGDPLRRYDSEIRAMDESLARLHRDLRWDDDTALLVVTDHGEEFQDHGSSGHRFSLHFELNRIAFLVLAPGRIAPQRVSDVNVSLIDAFATLLDLAGLAAPVETAGVSLLPLLRREPSAREALRSRPVFAHRERAVSGSALWAVMSGDHRLIVNDENQVPELFDFVRDSREREDLSAAEPATARQLLGHIEDFRASTRSEHASATYEATLDEELFEELRRLGYVSDREKHDAGGDH
jgi:arylsulfatase A-like enzyme